MNGKMKISILTVLFSLIASLSFAQEVEYELGSVQEVQSTWCGVEKADLNGADYVFNGKSYNSSVINDCRVLLYDSSIPEEWVDITDEAFDLGLFSLKLFPSGAVMGSTARLRRVSMEPLNIKTEWSGRTIRVALYFKNKNQEKGVVEYMDIEIIGPIKAENGVDKALYQIEPSVDVGFYNAVEANVVYLCEGEDFELKINNNEYPYGTTSSYYDNKYKATYSWQKEVLDLSNFDFESISDYKTGMSFVESGIATGTSKQYYYRPKLSVTKLSSSDAALGSCEASATPYIVRYNSPLKQNIALNGVKTLSSVICNGDELFANFEFLKDEFPYSNVVVDLYATDPLTGTESFVETFNSTTDFLEKDFGQLYALNGKNTFYKYRIVVYDMEGDVWDQDSEGNWTIFTRERHCPVEFEFQAEVKEMDAKITVGDMAEVCEDGDVELGATVVGYGSVSEGNYYTYEWTCDFAINSVTGVNDLTLKDESISYVSDVRKYVFAVSNNGCVVKSDPYEVIVHKRPIIESKEDKYSTCKDSEIEIGVTCDQSDVTYTWSPQNGVLSADGSSMTVNTATMPLSVGIYDYTITAVNNITGCTTRTPATMSVTINGLPTVVAVNPNPTVICIGNSVTVSAILDELYTVASPIEYTWSWTEKGVDKVETTTVNQLTFTPSETVAVSVSARDKNGCESEKPFDFVVTVNEKPDFTLSKVDGCDGGQLSIICEAGTGLDLSYEVLPVGVAPIGALVDDVYTVNLTSQSLVSVVTYEYSVRAVDNVTGCEDTRIVAVDVYPLPNVTLSSDKATLKYCIGEEITFTATATNVQYCWDGSMTNWVDNNTFTKSVSNSETFVVYVKDKNTGCVNSASLTYEVNALPDVVVTPETITICEGENTMLSVTDNVNYTYAWNTGENTREITVTPNVTSTYKVLVYDVTTTCSIEKESVVQVNMKPTFTIASDPVDVCLDETSTINFKITATNSVPVASYVWADTDVTGSGVDYSVTRTWDTEGDITFVVSALSGETPSCQSADVSVSIKVNKLPELNTPTASPERICKDSGDEVVLSASVVSGSNIEYEWFEGGTSIGLGSTIKVKPNATTTYSVVARDLTTLAKCVSVEKTVTVEVDNAPEKPAVTVSNNAYCSNVSIDPLLQVVTPVSGVVYQWYTSDGSFIGEGETLAVSPTSTTSYYVIAKSTLSSGCESEQSDAVEVVIHEAPIIRDETGLAGVSAIKVCEKGGIFMYVTSDTKDLIYTWSAGSTGMVDSTAVDYYLYMGNPINSGFVTIVAEDQYGCFSNEVIYEIVVDKLPIVTLSPLNPDVCEGEEVTIDVSTDKALGDVSIMWEKKNIAAASWDAISVTNPSSYTFVPEEDMLYQLYVSDNVTGCITDAVEVPVNIIDALEIVISDVNVGGQYCKDNDMQMTASVANAGSYTYTYEWYYGGTKIADGETFAKSGLALSDAGIYTVKVKCNETGCEGSLDQEIIVRDKIEVHIDSKYRDNMVCFGQSLELSVREEGTDYRWFVDGVELTTEKSQILMYPTTGIAAGTQIKVKQILTSSTGCPSDEVEETYTILDDFAATFAIKDGDNLICEDEEVTYVIDVASVQDNIDCYNNYITPYCVGTCDFPNVASYELFVNGVGQGVVDGTFGTSDVSYIASGLDDFSIYAQVKSIYGCEFTTPAIDVKVSNISIDNVSSLSGNSVYCIGANDEISVVASAAVNDNYNYEFIVDGVSVQSSSSNIMPITFSTVGTTEVKVIVADVDAKCVTDTIVTYEVKELPQAELLVNGTVVVDGDFVSECHGEIVDLSIEGTDFVVEIDGVEAFTVNYNDNPGVATISPADVDLSTYFSNKADIVISDATKLGLSLIGDYDDGDHVVRIKVTDPTTGCSQWSNAVTLHWKDEIMLSVPSPHEINTTLQLCLGETTTITASSKDATSFTFIPEGGTAIDGSSYSVVASALGTYNLTIQADNGCERNVQIEVVETPNPQVEVWTFDGSNWTESIVDSEGFYSLCSAVPTKIIAKGASSYNMNIVCDGESIVTDYAHSGDEFEYDFNSQFDFVSAGLSDYNEYSISYDMSVGTCVDATSIKLRVYRLPEAKLKVTPGNVVISGTPITFDVTSGYTQYDFYLNDVLVQSGTEATLVSTDITSDVDVKVVVYNVYGCSIVLEDKVSILEGIAPKNILQSSDYYCDDSDGIIVSVENPQEGITYELVGLSSGAAIKAEAGQAVEWTNVKILSGENPTTYNVVAYHEALPGETVSMLNHVVVREVKVPTMTRLLPYNSYVDVCNNGDVLQVETSELGVQYVLYHEDSEGNVVEVMRAEGNGGLLDLMSPNAKGKYSVVAYGVNGDVLNIVCPVTLDGVYEYNIPEFDVFTLNASPSNGNICEGGNGVSIILSGSESGRIYTLYKDGVPYTAVAPVEGNGNPIDFGQVFENGIYTIVSDYNNCSQSMNGNVTVTLFSKPFDFDVTVSDNGYFCENDGSVKVSVAGQEESYIYKLMGTVDETRPAEFVVVDEHIGDNSGAPFTFDIDINVAANYIVMAEIPNFEADYGACFSILGGGKIINVNSVSVNQPTIKVAKYVDDNYITEKRNNIVVCEDDFVDIIIGQTEDKTENYSVEYKLYCDGVYVDSRFDESVDDNFVVFKKQPATSAVGVYKYHVAVEKKVYVEGTEVKSCTVDYSDVVVSTVEIINRPADRTDGLTELLSINIPAPIPGVCEPASVVVENAQIGKVYRLYRLSEEGGEVIMTSAIRKMAESTTVQFNVEGKDDWYVVSVSNEIEEDGVFIQLCEDFLTPELHVVDNRFLENHKIDVPMYVCHGDIITIRMESSQVGVTYTLYRKEGEDANGRPYGTVISAMTASNTAGMIFDQTISEDGIYFVEATGLDMCPTLMDNEFEIKFNALPISYEFKPESAIGKRDDINTYCGTSEGVFVYLENSQDNVIYSLYNVNVEGKLVFIESKEGDTGNEIQFNTKITDVNGELDGTSMYVVSARNKLTNCTSNMKGRIEVLYMPEITTEFADTTIELNNCSPEYVITLPESEQMKNALYSLVGVDGSGNVVALDSKYASTGDITFTLNSAGSYEVIASYENAACEKRVGGVQVSEFFVENQNLTHDVECDGFYRLSLDNSQSDVQYILSVVDINNAITPIDTVSGLSGYSIAFTPGVVETTYNKLFVTATHDGTCDVTIDSVFVSDLEIYSPILPATTYEDSVKICSYAGVVEAEIDFDWSIGALYSWKYEGLEIDSYLADGSEHKFEYDTSKPGVYELEASYNGKCVVSVARRVLEVDKANIYNVSGNVSCDGMATIYMDGSQDGVTYSLYDQNGVLVGDTIGTGNPISFDVYGDGVVTYRLTASTGSMCTIELDEITLDFDHVVAPLASLDLYIEGEKWTSADTAEICPEAFTSIIADIQNVPIKEYHFFFNGVEYKRSNLISNTLIPSFDATDGKVTITLSVVTQTGCTFDNVDSLVVKVSNGVIDGTPLIAENNYPEYCEGEVGVRLAYLLPRKGEVYRLYKVGDFEDELMDIQEIPHYWIGETRDTLWLSGWGDEFTTDYKAYAKAGEYYVTVESEDGCTLESNHVVVVENPLPVTELNTVYFAHTFKNNIDEWEIDTTTISEEYGLLDTGHMILEDAQPGVTYTLYHIEKEAELQIQKASKPGQTLMFGPIINYKEPEVEEDTTVVEMPNDTTVIARFNKATISSSPEDWGEGIYTIIATNDSTGCTTEIGSVEFVEEQLVAYDVYLFMNKNQSIVKQSLYPSYPHKGNHKFIDWSSKVDVVWAPKVDQAADGTYIEVEDEDAEDYEKGSGYSKLKSKANIVFELLPTMKDSVFTVFDTLRYESPVEGCDSVFAFSSYEYFTIDSIGFDEATSTRIDSMIIHPSYVEGCDSVETKHYSYFKVENYTDTVKVPAGSWGRYGFDDFTGSQDYKVDGMSGMFVYAKRPSFFGQEVFRYRIYNKKMPSVRISNEAKITILCGNQESGDSATVFLIPNVISPNGDGFNDDFKILLPYNFSESESKLEVFNRWGTLVYRSSGTQYGGDCYGGLTPVDPVTIWDGTSKTSNMLTVGENLPSGTYFYVYTITLVDNNGFHNTKKLSGYIELRH